MTLQSSGAISLANVNVELGLGSTTTISLNQTSVRTLAGKASGTISMSDLYGKSASGTFSPNGGTTAGTAVSLYNYGAGGGAVSVTISCTASANWTISGRAGSTTGANYPVGTYNSLTSITLSLTNSSTSTRSTTWTINATTGTNTRYWTVTIDNDGLA